MKWKMSVGRKEKTEKIIHWNENLKNVDEKDIELICRF